MVVVIAGYGCGEEPKDEVSKLLLNLKKQSGVALGEIVDVEFNWNLETEEGVRGSYIVGKRMEALDISPDEPLKIKEFFESEGFVADVHNVAAGTIVEIDGYKKDSMVCSIRGGITGGEAGLEAEVVTEDVIVSCGEIQESDDVVGMANPASVYCENKGGELILITGVGGAAGYCILPDERTCQQWKFFYSEGEECESPKVEFDSDVGCKSACEEAGESAGSCKWTDELGEGETNLGACLIEASSDCGHEDKCYCGCSYEKH